MIYAQEIITSWTKASRGGLGAQARGRIPLALPIEEAKVGFLVVQPWHYAEKTAFETPYLFESESLKLEGALDYDSPRKNWGLRWNTADLTASFHWSHWNVGAPEIHFWPNANEKRLEVPLNGWVRLQWNGRFSHWDTGIWSYEHTVVNIAYFNAVPERDAFLTTPPADEFKRLAILR